MQRLADSVRTVRGFGPKKAALLEKMGITTLADALNAYPRDYDDRTRIVRIAALRDGEKANVRAVVGTTPMLHHVRKGMDVTRLTVFDGSGTLNVTYFNNKYVAAQLREGEEYLFSGRVQGEGAKRVMISRHTKNAPPGAGRGVLYPSIR